MWPILQTINFRNTSDRTDILLQTKKKEKEIDSVIQLLFYSFQLAATPKRGDHLTVTVLPEIIINFLNKKNNTFKVNKQWIFFFLISGKFSSSPERLVTARKQWQSAFYMMWDLAFCLFL